MPLVAFLLLIHPIVSSADVWQSPWDANRLLICENVREAVRAARNAGRDPKQVHLESLLHTCFKQAPYNLMQLPLFTGVRPGRKTDSESEPLMELEFDFNLKSIDKFETGGSMRLKAFVQFSWVDEFRRWNESEIPIHEISIPAREIWCANSYLSRWW